MHLIPSIKWIKCEEVVISHKGVATSRKLYDIETKLLQTMLM